MIYIYILVVDKGKNDIDMFKVSGVSYAPSNGEEVAKQAATHVLSETNADPNFVGAETDRWIAAAAAAAVAAAVAAENEKDSKL